jgi:hypothetical protein
MKTEQDSRQQGRKEEISHGNNSKKGGNGNSRQDLDLKKGVMENGSASESSRGGSGNSTQGKPGGSQRSGR